MKALRNIAIGLMLFALTVFVAVAVVTTNVRAMEFVVRQVLQRTAKEVQAFSLGSLVYSFPSSWTLGDVRATVLSKGKPALIYAGQVELKDVFHLLTDGKHAQVNVSGAEASYDQLKVRGASCAVDLSRVTNGIFYRGNILLADVLQEPFSISDLKTDFVGNEQSVVLSNLSAAVYGGRLSGTAVFTIPESYDVDLALQEVDSGELERAMGGVFRELGGKLSGQLHVAGSGQRIDLFDTSWNMPSGGAVSADLLSSITRYIPDSVQKKRIDFLIRSGGKLAVESFLFTLKNDSPEQLSGEIGIKSREANLELNVTHEIRVDARIDSLLQAWQAVFK
ncbi:MAG: hypothetical protein WCH86_00150 [Kiritimatiellales bacterium]